MALTKIHSEQWNYKGIEIGEIKSNERIGGKKNLVFS